MRLILRSGAQQLRNLRSGELHQSQALRTARDSKGRPWQGVT